MLTARMLETFHRQGFLVMEGAIESAQVEAIRKDVAGLPAKLRQAVPQGVGVTWPRRKVLGGASPEPEQVLYPDRMSDPIAQLLTSGPVVEMMHDLVGPTLAVHHTKVVMKSARTGGPVPWHQDWAYWRTTSPAPLQVNCLVYLDDADKDNGCLEVVPASHLRGLRAHRRKRRGATAFGFELEGFNEPSDDEVVSIPGPAGTAILFGPFLVHRSARNRSTRPRKSMTLTFTPAGIGDSEARVLQTKVIPQEVSTFFRASDIPKMMGHGPHLGQCAGNYRRRELWKLAASFVAASSDAWIIASESDAELDALEWATARKPASAKCVYLHPYLRPSLRRDDVRLGSLPVGPDGGDISAIVGGVRGAIVFVESETYDGVGRALQALGPLIQTGTVLIFDRFYGDTVSSQQPAIALWEFARQHLVALEFLGRADSQAAARVVGRGGASSVSVRQATWRPTVGGLRFGIETTASPEPAAEESALPPKLQWLAPILGDGPDAAQRLRRFVEPGRRVAERLRPLGDFFPGFEVPRFRGDGPVLGFCPTHSRRRELWLHAISFVDDPSRPWCEFGVADGESLDWLALHKDQRTMLHGFDSFEGIPEAWGPVDAGHWSCAEYVPQRPDVRIHKGRFDATLSQDDIRGQLGPGLGLIHIDCDLYSSTRIVLQALRDYVVPGTVFIFDEFCGYDGWREHEARAFRELVFERGMRFEYLSRSDAQVALRILSVGGQPGWSVRPFDWTIQTGGIYVEPAFPIVDEYRRKLGAIGRKLGLSSPLGG